MVMALHGLGLRVVLDVVFNHTACTGPSNACSVLDKLVPGYALAMLRYAKRTLTPRVAVTVVLNHIAYAGPSDDCSELDKLVLGPVFVP